MPELEIGKIPWGLATQSGFIDFSTFLWGILIIGAAFFFFIGTFSGLRRAFQDGSKISPSIVWFLNLAVFVYGMYLLVGSFKSQVASILILGLVLAGVIGFGGSLNKKGAEAKSGDKVKSK